MQTNGWDKCSSDFDSNFNSNLIKWRIEINTQLSLQLSHVYNFCSHFFLAFSIRVSCWRVNWTRSKMSAAATLHEAAAAASAANSVRCWSVAMAQNRSVCVRDRYHTNKNMSKATRRKHKPLFPKAKTAHKQTHARTTTSCAPNSLFIPYKLALSPPIYPNIYPHLSMRPLQFSMAPLTLFKAVSLNPSCLISCCLVVVVVVVQNDDNI